jgi:hypothetical protein
MREKNERQPSLGFAGGVGGGGGGGAEIRS